MQEDVTNRNGNDQQIAETATGSSCSIKDDTQQKDIQQGNHKQMHITAAAVQQHSNQHIDQKIYPAGYFVNLRVAQLQQAVAGAGVSQNREADPQYDSVKVIES